MECKTFNNLNKIKNSTAVIQMKIFKDMAWSCIAACNLQYVCPACY